MNQRCNDLSAGDSLFSRVRWPKARRPRRAEILAVLEEVVPWSELDELVRPHYRADIRGTGRPGYSLAMMIRARVVQIFWSLSDDGTEAVILDSHTTARFIGTDPWQPRPPSASKIRAFRQMLADHVEPEFTLQGAELPFIRAGLQFRVGEIREPVFRANPRKQS